MRITVALLAAALLVAACGSSTPAAKSHETSAYAMAQCMRAHRVTNFPDPTNGPGGQGFSVVQSSGGSLTVNGIVMAGPVFDAANTACKFGPQSGSGGGVPAAQRQGMIANARCIREHGLANFPDPTFGAEGGVSLDLGPGLDARSPAIERAARACRHVGTPLPGVGFG